jgi:hypothetical protein
VHQKRSKQEEQELEEPGDEEEFDVRHHMNTSHARHTHIKRTSHAHRTHIAFTTHAQHAQHMQRVQKTFAFDLTLFSVTRRSTGL